MSPSISNPKIFQQDSEAEDSTSSTARRDNDAGTFLPACIADPRFDHPFGRDITLDQLAQQLDHASSWEAKNRLLVQLSRQLPDWTDEQKSSQNKVAGCESQAWLALTEFGDELHIAADSDSRIVKGLLALVLTAFNRQSAAQISQFDFEAWLNARGMQRFLSASRGNGLRAIVKTIRDHASKIPM
ncbi:SufE family protein [Chitinibacter sp. S2-10]|uniref:SufE family protein n=1 Tax=Chitinibacter sp. S2-10 TaxID=3373597 RepID=UPI0039778288